MAKSKLIHGLGDDSLVDLHGEVISSVPKVSGVKPTGSQVLIEFLTAQELSGVTTLVVTTKNDGPTKVPLQGYVRDIGPNVHPEAWGFKVGDRVMISGSGVQAPNYDGTERERFLMEPHAIKAVLSEAV